MNSFLDSRTRRFLLPTRVLWSRDAENAAILLENNWGQALAQPVPCCTLKKDSALMLDFGRELNGSLQLVSGATQGNAVAKLRLRLGESASEAMGTPNNDHAAHDFEISLSPMGSQKFGLSGFRFARLDLLDDLEVQLVCARAETLECESTKIGSFRCNDERLNEIWNVGAETVRLCLQDFIWDGIKRDRLVWMGDLHPEISVITRVWGILPIVPASLDWVRDHTPLPEWMNTLGSYSLWWIILQRDWLRASGDLAYLQQQRVYLQGLLTVVLEQIDESGTVFWRGYQFLDWPSSPNPAAVTAGLHALLKMALDAASELFQALGNDEWAQKCRVQSEVLVRFAPSLPESQHAAVAGNKQAAALLLLAGLADAEVANAQVLAIEPLQGISTFYGYYVLQARAQAGDFVGALKVIRQYWGAMIDLGATSFWEDFDLSWTENAGRIDELPTPQTRDLHFERGDYCYKSWRHSLCHGWAAGPTAWLSEHVLGFQIVEDGGRRLRIAPQLGDLEWAEGDFPTRFGPVHVRHEKLASGAIQSCIEAPDEVEIEQVH